MDAVIKEILAQIQTRALNYCENQLCKQYEVVFSKELTKADFAAVPSEIFEPLYEQELAKARAEIKGEISDALSAALYPADY